MYIKHNGRQRGQARVARVRCQAGVTLIETMIGLALSLIVTASMVALMSNSMGTATRIIQMSQLTDELRNSMSMMTRDVRRANYSANAVYCYANSDCGIDGSATQSADITVSNGSCFTFNLDRNQDGDASTDNAGGFRRVLGNSIGRIEMWIGNSSPDCAVSDANWVAVTDPDFVDVTTLAISDARSFTGTVIEEGGTVLTQRIREINIQMEGRLILDNSITRRIEGSIRVRNDYLN